MSENYKKLILMNLDQVFIKNAHTLAERLPARREGEQHVFQAFGHECRIHPHGILMDGREEGGPRGVVLSLYALHAVHDDCLCEPLAAFRELPNSMPYAGAFKTHTEIILSPFVQQIQAAKANIMETLSGCKAPSQVAASGDFAFTLRPLPKILLTYVFYLPDEDFPASASCLFSSNASAFLPTDALADLGEYTSRRILELAGVKMNEP